MIEQPSGTGEVVAIGLAPPRVEGRAAQLRPYLLILPAVAFIGVLLFWPFFTIVKYSLYTHTPSHVYVPRLTLDNYRALGDRFYLEVLWRTTWYSVVTSGICFILGYPLAYLIARARPRLKTLLIFLIILPLLIGAVVRTYGWIVMFSQQGPVVRTMLLLHVGGPFPRIIGTNTAVIIGLVDALLPFMVLPLISAVNKIPRALEDASATLGARPVQTFLHVLLPLSARGLASGGLMVFLLSMGALVTPIYLGGVSHQTVATLIWSDMLTTLNWPMGAALAVLLMATIAVLALLYLLLIERLGKHARGATM